MGHNENLLRSQRNIAREEARARMGDPPNTACRIKLALGKKPSLSDHIADEGRSALAAHIITCALTALLILASPVFLILTVPYVVTLAVLWRKAPAMHAAELERRKSVKPAAPLAPAAPIAAVAPAPPVDATAVTAPMAIPAAAPRPLAGARRHARQ